MTFAAGIDVGNSSTEVVLARLGSAGIEILGTARAPTRRRKGSPQSLDGAVALVRRLEREHGVRISCAAAARLRPVETLTRAFPRPAAATGRLEIIAAGARTAGGQGFAVGRPYLLDDRDAHADADAGAGGRDQVIAVVPAGMGYRVALERLRPLARAGRLAAVLLADDEAVLVSNRLGLDLPVIDEIDAAAAATAWKLAVEVAGPDVSTLRALTDPLRLAKALALDDAEQADAARLARLLHDSRNAVVALHENLRPALPPSDSSPEVDGAVDDRWSVDLAAIADAVLARNTGGATGAGGSRTIGVATLRADAPLTDPSQALAELLGVPVTAGDESRAAWAGGLSTPGANAPGSQATGSQATGSQATGSQAADSQAADSQAADSQATDSQAADSQAAGSRATDSRTASSGTVVIDLGGGTIDAVSASSAVVCAGGGELLTASVAALAGTTSAAAEWAKRGPAHRVEAPQLLLGEDGERSFLDSPAPAEAIGALVVRGPAGLLAFNRTLAPGEWRALRLRLKIRVIGGNVLRSLQSLDAGPRTVIVLGGPAGDEEVLSALARSLPDGVAIARGNVGGALGHRYAVAYGLLSLLDGQHPAGGAPVS